MSVARLTNRPTYKTAHAYAVEHVIRQTTSKEPILAYISTLYSVPEGFVRQDFEEALREFFEAKIARQRARRPATVRAARPVPRVPAVRNRG